MNIKPFLERHSYSEPMTIVLNLFEDLPNVFVLNEKLKPFGLTITDLRTEGINVLIDYIKYILEDNLLTQQEMDSLEFLKKYLRIKEGDFFVFHKEQIIQDVIYGQMKIILADLRVEKNEALVKTNLQKLFDLSYDQFLQFESNAVQEALDNGANIKDLDTII